MWWMRILAVIFILGGISSLELSSYIDQRIQVESGKAHRKVDAVTGSPLLEKAGPYGKQSGQIAGQVAHNQINATAAEYAMMVTLPYWGGIVLIALGILFALFSFISCKKR